jgi:hypothetical protein
MTSVSHGTVPYSPERPQWAEFFRIPQMWASMAISIMWLAVVFDSVFGPDFVSKSAGGDATTIPSGIFVAFFAWLGTIAVARYGLQRDR